MIHTDVKPANILVSSAGHATLIDFGFVQTSAEASQWATRPLAGTLAYIAPEMVTSALAAGPPSDIYSLGVTLYEMLTGLRPWNTEDPAELALRHREAKPTDIREHRPELPAANCRTGPLDACQRSASQARFRSRVGHTPRAAGNPELHAAISRAQLATIDRLHVAWQY